MTCRDATDFLTAYLAGELAEPVRQEFELHLGRCPNCEAFLVQMRATIEAGRAVAADEIDRAGTLPDELVQAIMRAVTSGR